MGQFVRHAELPPSGDVRHRVRAGPGPIISIDGASKGATVPWIPLGPGESFKPLRFLPSDRGRVLLLRLEPGTVVPLHRHLGEVHAFNLAGHRKLLETGEVIGPGGYVYEPAGNVDAWMAVGEEPAIVHIASYGAMEYLGETGEVLRRDTASSLRVLYLAYCAGNGIAPLELG